MRNIRNSKRGFTLVEMMLALAIICIIGWTTVALMIAIKDSFMTTYNVNDSADYALLYANGFENSYLAHTQANESGTFRIREADSVLCSADSSTPVFTPSQMKTKGGTVDKWVVRMYFSIDPTDASQVVKYKIFVLDNYYSPNFKLMCKYEGSVWAPHLKGTLSLDTKGSATDPGHQFIKNNYASEIAGYKDTVIFTKFTESPT